MTRAPQPASARDLVDYLDGEMDGPRTRAFEALVRQDPTLAAQIADWRRQNTWLQDTFEPLAHRPLPDEMVRVLGGLAAAVPSQAASASPVVALASKPASRQIGTSRVVPMAPIAVSPSDAHPHGASALRIAVGMVVAFMLGGLTVYLLLGQAPFWHRGGIPIPVRIAP